MKKIKCNLPISSIKILNEIVKFEGFNVQNNTIVVSDRIADALLNKKGFKLVEDLNTNTNTDTVKKANLNKSNIQSNKKTWVVKLKSLFNRR